MSYTSGWNKDHGSSSQYPAGYYFQHDGRWYYRNEQGQNFLSDAPSTFQHRAGESTQQRWTTGRNFGSSSARQLSTAANYGSADSTTLEYLNPTSDDTATSFLENRDHYNPGFDRHWGLRQYMTGSPDPVDVRNDTIHRINQQIPQHDSLLRHGECNWEIDISDDSDDRSQHSSPKSSEKSRSKSKPSSSSRSGSGSGSRSSKSDSKYSSGSSKSSSRSSKSGSGSGSRSSRSRGY